MGQSLVVARFRDGISGRVVRGFLVTVVAMATSSLNLLLLVSELTLWVYCFDVALILLLYCLLSREYVIRLNARTDFAGISDLFFPIVSLTMLMGVTARSQSVLMMPLAVVCAFFLPGYTLLRLVRFKPRYGLVERTALAFVLSIGCTSLAFTLVSLVHSRSEILLSVIYFVVSVLPLLERATDRAKLCVRSVPSDISLFDVSLLSGICLFYVCWISALYPQMAHVLGLDIVVHFSDCTLILNAPSAYQAFYPWFNLPLATVYSLATPSIELFQSGVAYLSIVVVFSFYTMAKAYLEGYHNHSAAIATFLFSLCSGFGWLQFLQGWLQSEDSSRWFNLLVSCNNYSYLDVGYGQGPWLLLWFRPMTVSFTILFLLVYLLRDRDTSKPTYLMIFASLVLTHGLVHYPELVLFQFLLLAATLLSDMVQLPRLKEATTANLLGVVAYSLYAPIMNRAGGIVGSPPPAYAVLALVGTAAASYILSRRCTARPILSSFGWRRILNITAPVMALAYLSCLLAWLASAYAFSVTWVVETYYIPLAMYPVLLGVSGLFSIHGVRVVAKGNRQDPAGVIVVLLFLTFLFMKLFSILNVMFVPMNYGERRFLPVLFALASILASVSVTQLGVGLLRRKHRLLLSGALSLIVVAGVMSTNLSLELQKTLVEKNAIDSRTMEAIAQLSSPHNRDIEVPILTISDVARRTAAFLPTSYLMDVYRYPVWESLQAEVPLLILYNNFYNPPDLLLTPSDYEFIKGKYSEGYMARSMLGLLETRYNTTGVMLLGLPGGVPPATSSETVLLLPDATESSSDFLACQALSLGGVHFTTAIVSDLRTILGARTVVIPCDRDEFVGVFKMLVGEHGDKNIVVFNPDGYGPLSDFFYESVFADEVVEATQVDFGGSSTELGGTVTASSLTPRNGFLTNAWYSDGIHKTPFSVSLSTDKRKIVYLNLYPIVAARSERREADSRLVLDVTMHELVGTTVLDSSAYENNGVAHLTRTVSSVFGRCLDLDGVRSFVSIPSSSELNPAGEITLTAWVRPRDPQRGFCIISKSSGYGTINGYYFLYSAGNFYFALGNGTHFFPNQCQYGRLLAGRWYHLAVVYDGRSVTYYVDGAAVGVIKISEKIAPNNLDLLIGKRHDGDFPLNGSVCELAIYNKALNASEIKESYDRALERASMPWLQTNCMATILPWMAQISGINFTHYDNYEPWVYSGHTAFFRKASLTGRVILRSSSYVMMVSSDPVRITVDSTQGLLELMNVTSILVACTQGNGSVEIIADGVELQGGRGFYVGLTLTDPLLLTPNGSMEFTVVQGNGSTYQVTVGEGPVRVVGRVELWGRNPTVLVEGKARFEDMYSLFTLYPELRTLGQDLEVQGTIEFRIVASDVYTFASDFRWYGSAARSPPVLSWNEGESLMKVLPYLVIMALFWLFCQWFTRSAT